MAIYKKMRTALGDSTELSHKVYVDGDAGAGTTDYIKLDNKPAINGIILEGDVSLDELGISSAIVNIENGEGENSLQQKLEAESWPTSNTNLEKYLENYDDVKHQDNNIKVGTFGKSSFAEGGKSQTVGTKAHAEGSKNVALGNNSHAEGNETFAAGLHSHAEGNTTTSAGNASHAEGYKTLAVGIASHTEGSETEALGDFGHAEGALTHANSPYTHAEGLETVASEVAAHAEGGHTEATQECAHAEGYYTHAIGQYSHAEGCETTAEGSNAHAEGRQTHAFGWESHAEGGNTVAQGGTSHAEGYYTIAIDHASHVQGQFNDPKEDRAFIIGNGEDEDHRSNALEVDWNGNAWFTGTVYATGKELGKQEDIKAVEDSLKNYALINETGSYITLEIDKDYRITAKLYDKNNIELSSSTPIDLPLEGMIVGGDYDSATKEVILTLTNGDDVRFSVADLVSGLQSEITTSNPLNVKYISGLANVATSGSYNDLTNKPTIPAAQVNADWNATAGLAMILNKPTIPTKVSELTNDKNYMTTIPEAYTAAIEEALGTKVDLTDRKTVVDTTKTYEDNIWYNANAINAVCNDFIRDLGSIERSVPTTTSQLTNNSGFITKSVSDLTNYTNNNNLSSLMSAKQNITDNTLNTTNKTVIGAINEVNSIAKGANQAIGFNTYADMIDHLSAQGKGSYRLGQSIYITTLGVPDLWISEILDTAVTYTYTSDADFIATLGLNGKVQVGHYCVSALETQKVDLTNYIKNTDYATGQNAGLIIANSSNGVYMTGAQLKVALATEDMIDARTNQYRPIVPSNLDYAVKSVVGGHVVVTQKEYDDMVADGTIDENTFYYFKGE